MCVNEKSKVFVIQTVERKRNILIAPSMIFLRFRAKLYFTLSQMGTYSPCYACGGRSQTYLQSQAQLFKENMQLKCLVYIILIGLVFTPL